MDIQDELAKVALTTVAKVAIDKLIGRLSRRASGKIEPALVKERLIHHARQVTSVKTLLSTDSHVPIGEFYYSPRLVLGGRSLRPSGSQDFRYDHVLIEGVAGQGKSILLRYLCADSIINHGRLAFYYELRRMNHLQPLITVLMESLQEVGLPGNTESVKTLSVERDIEVYLDGFDEVDQKAAEKIDRDIQYFVTNYPYIRVFVTSRPHVGLSKNSNLTAYRIEDLNQEDVFKLVGKLCRDTQMADSLREKLRTHSGNAIELLETPLLVTLLVAQYTQTQQIPEQLSEFYDTIFAVLFERHDSFKTPFQRKKRLAITTHAYRKVFQKFCYGSLFAVKLDVKTAHELAEWAIGTQGFSFDAADFLNDISDVSSLINDEGGVWTFIHTSVQEFYAAAFILAGSDEELGSCAQDLVSIPNSASREQIFRFAREIQEYRFIRFVELSFYERLSCPLSVDEEVSADNCVDWLIAHVVDVAVDKNRVSGGVFFSVWTDCVGDSPIRMFALSKDEKSLEQALAHEGVAERIHAVLNVKEFKAKLVKEVGERVTPYLKKRKEYLDFIEVRASERAKSSGFLKGLMERR